MDIYSQWRFTCLISCPCLQSGHSIPQSSQMQGHRYGRIACSSNRWQHSLFAPYLVCEPPSSAKLSLLIPIFIACFFQSVSKNSRRLFIHHAIPLSLLGPAFADFGRPLRPRLVVFNIFHSRHLITKSRTSICPDNLAIYPAHLDTPTLGHLRPYRSTPGPSAIGIPRHTFLRHGYYRPTWLNRHPRQPIVILLPPAKIITAYSRRALRVSARHSTRALRGLRVQG